MLYTSKATCDMWWSLPEKLLMCLSHFCKGIKSLGSTNSFWMRHSWTITANLLFHDGFDFLDNLQTAAKILREFAGLSPWLTHCHFQLFNVGLLIRSYIPLTPNLLSIERHQLWIGTGLVTDQQSMGTDDDDRGDGCGCATRGEIA